MRELNQFILCNGKVPVAPAGNTIDPHNPLNWMSYDDARQAANVIGYGVGFVFTSADPYWFLDIDHCLTPERQWTPLATSLMEAFPGALMEVSQSGEGIHIFGAGAVPEHSCKNKDYGIEFYHQSRFVLLNSEIPDAQHLDFSHQIAWLVQNYFQPGTDSTDNPWRSEPVPEWNGPTDDQILIEKMLNSGGAKAVFGGKATFRDLWEANDTVLGANYPAFNEKDPYDRSSADAALANHLAFWTGKNHERMRQLMNQSALVRDKWTKHKNYLAMTIHNGVNGCRDVYCNAPPAEPVVIETPTDPNVIAPVATVGVQFLSAHQQVEHFQNCVYIRRSHRVLTPQGMMMKPEVFAVTYGGYVFAVDAENQTTTKSAWEAFTQSQAVRFPKVDGTCFRPNLPAYTIVNEDGADLVNTYVPINTPRRKGDVTLFLNHARKLFPNGGDYEIFMAYMAAMVQYVGKKFQWCPIIQGVEGNGKTLFFRCIERSLGSRYCHSPNASDLAGGGLKFNGWIEGKTAIFLEEIYISDRKEIIEPLKVLITNDRIEIQYKGQDQFTGDNVANFMVGTNHKDAIRLNYDQRRYTMLYAAQQKEGDLKRDGMTEGYFHRIWTWLKEEDGFAAVNDFLLDYKIPEELNPATLCQRAPKSSSTKESVEISRGMIEQRILECIDEERPGFKGGYVSSKTLDDLLVNMKMDNKISPQRRKDIMDSLGYIRHPWLNDGRVNMAVVAEQCRPIIYTNLNLDGVHQVDPPTVLKQYEIAQGYILQEIKVESVK